MKKKPGNVRAFSYVRFSTPEQMEGDSLRRQLAGTLDYCGRHGLTLDEALTFRDLGISAFRGDNVKDGALGGLLKAIERGKIPAGSVVVVENLDRLSRQQIPAALSIFLNILETGVEIATLSPERRYTRDSVSDLVGLLEPLMHMSLAYEESKKKSERLGAVWTEKRRRMADGEAVPHRTPPWIRREGGAFVLVPERAAVVRRVFRLASEGYGATAIVRKLLAEGVTPLWSRWHRSYLLDLLRSRTVLGEMQPMTGRERGKRRAVGSPVPGYYPAVVSEAEFYAVQGGLDRRTGKRGRTGRDGNHVASLFTGLLKWADDGTSAAVWRHGLYASLPYTRREPGAITKTFPVAVLERAFFDMVAELTASDVDGGVEREIAECAGRLAEVETKIASIRRRIKDEASIDLLISIASELDGERRGLAERLETLRGRKHTETSETVGETKSLVSMLSAASGEDLRDLRTRLKSRIASLVSEMWLTSWRETHPASYARGGRQSMTLKFGLMQVFLRDGTVRSVLIRYQVRIPNSVIVFGDWRPQRPCDLWFDLREWDGSPLNSMDVGGCMFLANGEMLLRQQDGTGRRVSLDELGQS